MTAIKTSFGSGGAGLTPGGSSGNPDLATTLREIADDLAAINAAAAKKALVGAPLAADADLPTCVARVNAIVLALNAGAGVTLTTTKA